MVLALDPAPSSAEHADWSSHIPTELKAIQIGTFQAGSVGFRLEISAAQQPCEVRSSLPAIGSVSKISGRRLLPPFSNTDTDIVQVIGLWDVGKLV